MTAPSNDELPEWRHADLGALRHRLERVFDAKRASAAHTERMISELPQLEQYTDGAGVERWRPRPRTDSEPGPRRERFG